MRIPFTLLVLLASAAAEIQGTSVSPAEASDSVQPQATDAAVATPPTPAANDTPAPFDDVSHGTGVDGSTWGKPMAGPGPAVPNDASASAASPYNNVADPSPAAGNATPVASAECSYCTVPAGYTAEHIAAPLNVVSQFNSRWQAAYAKASKYLKDWTTEDKVALATGVGWMQGRCVGNTAALPQHQWAGLCAQDSPLGVRFTDHNSAFPAAINAAATFDKGLIYQRGKAMGEEFKGKGVNVALGPMTNMGRVAAGGRNWEGFGGDPYLSGFGASETVKGLQDAGVQACVKHLVGNEQERNRTTSSSNIDDRTLREVYTHPFLRAVQADVASVMCSYNLINGSWGCQNSKTLNGVLKTDYGFAGYVMSDWDATHSGVNGANNGLDMDMPGDIGYNGGKTSHFGANLTQAVNNGSVPVARLDDMVLRIMAAWYLVGQDQNYPPVNFDAWKLDGVNNSHVNVMADHDKVIRDIDSASIVLLKNRNGTLPLKAPQSVTVVGNDMAPPVGGPNGCGDRGCSDGTLAMGWGSGTVNFPYLIDPASAIQTRAREDGASVNWWFNNWDLAGAAKATVNAEVAIVGVNSDSGEGYITVDGNEGDRNNLSAWHNGDELIKAVAAVHPNTVVVVHSVGPMDMEQWIDHPNVTAVLWAGIPGQESGNGLVDVLYGKTNPSARLPYTIAKNRTDYPADIDYVNTNTPRETDVNYTEGLFIDYRFFLSQKKTPRFGFGFGLSYTTFEHSGIAVNDVAQRKRRADKEQKDPNLDGCGAKIGAHMTDDLHRPRWQVSGKVRNTGSVGGHDVPQLYLAFPEGSGEPPRVLRDFDRVWVDAGATADVNWKLSKYDVSIWDVVSQTWVVPEGEFKAVMAKDAFDGGVEVAFTPSV